MSKPKRDRIVSRLAMICVLAGLDPMAWFTMTATEFDAAIKRRCRS